MSRVTESIRAFNSTLRTLMGLAMVAVFGAVGWFGYEKYVEPGRRLDAVRADLVAARELLQAREEQIEAQQQQIAELETSLKLLKVDHRIAELRVLEQREDAATGRTLSTVAFVEINADGAPIDEPKEFTIEGDLVYVEAKVVQFQDRFVEQADPDRSTSLCLFRRLFGEYQEPQEGFLLDEFGSRPTAYARGGTMSEFEKDIWKNFWDIAHDPERAKSLGVRTLNIEAPAMQVRPGKTYKIILRASGGLSISTPEAIRPESNPPSV